MNHGSTSGFRDIETYWDSNVFLLSGELRPVSGDANVRLARQTSTEARKASQGLRPNYHQGDVNVCLGVGMAAFRQFLAPEFDRENPKP